VLIFFTLRGNDAYVNIFTNNRLLFLAQSWLGKKSLACFSMEQLLAEPNESGMGGRFSDEENNEFGLKRRAKAPSFSGIT